MTLPLVSIVVPSYGQGAFLEETLVSVLAQDYPRLEVLVVDGGSTDDSVDVIRRHAGRLAWWVSEPDRGQADALNKGFARATGDLLGWVCSDDTLLPGAVSAVVAALKAEPAALLAYGDAVVVDAEGRRGDLLPSRPWDLVEMVRTCQNHVVQPGSLFTRRAWELAGPLVVESHYYFDFELVLKLALAGSAVRLQQPLATYRLHAESKSTAGTLIKATDHQRLIAALFARDDLPAAVRAVEREARSRSELTAGEYYYAAGDLARARACYVAGLRLHPAHLDRRSAGLLARTLVPRPLLAAARSARSR
jgi:glycosyltransferase involved in cell wall biosynthesis